jgi:hypothetical protein
VTWIDRWIPTFGGDDSAGFDIETLKNELRELLGHDGVLLCPGERKFLR